MDWTEADLKKYALVARIGGLMISSFALFLLYRHDLWGNETRLFFTGLWLLMAGFMSYLPAFRKQINFFLLSTLGGFLAVAGFPPYPLLPLFLFAFVPLFWLESVFYEKGMGQRWFLFYIFNFFLIWNLGTTFWIANTAFLPGIVGMGINAMLMTLVVWWISWIHRKLNVDWYFAVVFIAAWLTFEFIHLRWELSWPWLNIGNALARWPVVAQWYEFTGVLGGSAWILAVNYLFFLIIKKNGLTWGIIRLKSFLYWVLWVVIPVCLSVLIYFTTPLSGPEVSAVVINPNIEPHYEKFDQDVETRWAIYRKLLDEALSYNPDLIMLPETVFGQVNVDNMELNPYISRVQQMLENYGSEARVLLGIASYRAFEEKKAPDRSSVRKTEGRDGFIYYWEAYNSAILLGNDTIPIYHKQKLVPGAESFPYRKLLFFLNPIIDQLGGTVYGYGRVDSQDVFEFGQVKIAPVICYESVYGEYMRKYIAKGANVIGIITNDGWWGDTEGHKQHYQFAALRAIEYRRSVLRSANLGSNGAFNERGDEVVTPNDYNVPAVIPVKVTMNSSLTFYAIWGDYLGRFSIFLMVFLTLKALVNTVIRKQ